MLSLVFALVAQSPGPSADSIQQYAVWKDGARIGTSVQVIHSITYQDKPAKWYRSTTVSDVSVARYEAVLDDSGLPLQVAVEVRAGRGHTLTRATLDGAAYQIKTYENRSLRSLSTVPVRDRSLLRSEATTPVLVDGRISTAHRRYQTLDLSLKAIVDGQMSVLGTTDAFGDKAHIVSVSTGASRSTLYVSESGRVLRVENSDGSTMVPDETAGLARELVSGPSLLL